MGDHVTGPLGGYIKRIWFDPKRLRRFLKKVFLASPPGGGSQGSRRGVGSRHSRWVGLEPRRCSDAVRRQRRKKKSGEFKKRWKQSNVIVFTSLWHSEVQWVNFSKTLVSKSSPLFYEGKSNLALSPKTQKVNLLLLLLLNLCFAATQQVSAAAADLSDVFFTTVSFLFDGIFSKGNLPGSRLAPTVLFPSWLLHPFFHPNVSCSSLGSCCGFLAEYFIGVDKRKKKKKFRDSFHVFFFSGSFNKTLEADSLSYRGSRRLWQFISFFKISNHENVWACRPNPNLESSSRCHAKCWLVSQQSFPLQHSLTRPFAIHYRKVNG